MSQRSVILPPMGTFVSPSEHKQQRQPPSALAVVRFSRGWSQAALAARAGVSKKTVVNLERGHVEPRLRTARAIAAALQVDLHELFPPERREPAR